MSHTNESHETVGTDEKPDEKAPGVKLERAIREAGSKLNQVGRRVQRDLARKAAGVEEDIAADEAERDLIHSDLKEGDIEILGIMTVNQESKYDVYADSHGPASTRPLDE